MQALRCFVEQSYPNKELIIVDDLDDRSFDAPPELENVHYFVRDRRESIPAKRNICCGLAHGEIIWHLDSDDFSSPERMAHQVSQLEESGKDVTGYNSMPFFDEGSRKSFLYDGAGLYAVGTSLAYNRSWWERHPFTESPKTCEDNLFNFAARKAKQLTAVPCGEMMVARIHSENTTKKYAQYFTPLPIEQLAKGFAVYL